MGERRSYTFSPLERRGLIAGLQGSQLATFGGGCLLAVAVMRAAPTPAALFAGAVVVAGAAAAACCTCGGRPAASWVPVAAAWLWRRLSRSAASPQPGIGHRAAIGGPAPAGAAATGTPRLSRPVASAAGATSTACPPPAVAGIDVVTVPALAGRPPLAVVRDRRAGTLAAVVAVRGRSFSLLDPEDKDQRLGAWGAALAALAREGSPVHRLQWVERTQPAASDDLVRYLDRAGTGEGAGRHSYARLVATAGAVTQDHQVLVVLAVRSRRAGSRRPPGSGHGAAFDVLRRELGLLEGQLGAADLVVERVLDETDLALAVGTTGDPDARSRRPGRHLRLTDGWPLAVDEGWRTYRTDGLWHATYWVAEWPRVDVGPDFLAAMLLSPGVRRTVAVTMGPVGPARAARQVESARTADLADEELRRRAGFLTTARRRREAEGVVRRSSELADGHAEYRFTGYVTVSACDRTALDTACAEVEQSASQSHLELRRLYGRQEEAFTWTLPLARGLA